MNEHSMLPEFRQPRIHVTPYNVRKILELISKSHKYINSFECIDIYQFNAKADRLYPCMFMNNVWIKSELGQKQNFDYGHLNSFRFTVAFLDRYSISENKDINSFECSLRMDAIAEQCWERITMLGEEKLSSYCWDFSNKQITVIGTDFNTGPVFADDLTGVMLDFTVDGPVDVYRSSCQDVFIGDLQDLKDNFCKFLEL